MAATLLLIQNSDSVQTDLEPYLQSQNYNLRSAESVREALKMIDDNGFKPSAILVDLVNVSDQDMGLLEDMDESLGVHEWVFIADQLSDDVSERLEELSYRTLTRPCSLKLIESTVRKAVRSAMVRRRLDSHAKKTLHKKSFSSIVGSSPVIKEHRQILRDLSKVPLSTLMIKGETGTGKGHAAGILHKNGLRKDFSFVEMNCAALPSELVESQLFGHEAGSFTGAKGRHRGLLEQADNGTLFLDEIGEMPLDVQAKLLKAIEEQSFRRVGGEHEISVDVQVFAASNQNLQQMVVDGEFREDLYHRLNVFEISVPALREYKSDLLELVPIIIAEYNAKSGKKVRVIPDQAWAELMDYDWPGNIRELRNALERAILLAKGETLNTQWLNLNNTLLERQLDGSNTEHDTDTGTSADNVSTLKVVRSNELAFTLDGNTSLEDMDRSIIECALKVSQYNISKAATLLGATRETIRYRVQKYELDTGAGTG